MAKTPVKRRKPASSNPVVAELQAAFDRSGLTKSEVARRMDTTLLQIGRILNPENTNHSTDSLRRFADAVGARLVIGLVDPNDLTAKD